ncbi:hypothetical protein TPHV1_260020 [Treponema phagedenis]|uniref:Uncharacterized protein n=1 Tax=Treponema phagedenis TaxID=162 RepID=A0A0B7GZF0_TREPH|nr:hypothetical protein TPHV1_260020 [Treponema phagedenis]
MACSFSIITANCRNDKIRTNSKLADLILTWTSKTQNGHGRPWF